ncbi:hypothetical protein [Variovorax sp. OV084]|uniref:hypothetical protein n=1 Tax=Variovorax sp. OV084 TaxID=1882777 RepID=UPI0008BD0378|nr:hypothetical protein [Variovorax sp. OV084]SES76335.1 hypothetical protein SAMN05443580_101204 [Variovorax sp. OV084]
MPAPPAKNDISGSGATPSNAQARSGFGALWECLFGTGGFLGTTGNQPEARAGLGIPSMLQYEVVLSGGNLVLLPRDGNLICINGYNRPIPAAGVTLAATGTAANTSYNIYAYWTGSAVALERDTASHALDANYGVRVKSTDATRTLLAKARTVSAGAWVNSSSQRFLINWVNGGRKVSAKTALPSTLTTSSTSPQFLGSVEFLSWGNETISVSLAGGMQNNTANAVNFIGIGLDSNTVSSTPSSYGQAAVNNGYMSLTQTYPIDVATEGNHSLSILGWVNSGIGSFLSGSGMSAMVSV